MPAVDRTTLYSYFETGRKPSQSQFEDLIDSSFNLAEDSVSQGSLTYNWTNIEPTIPIIEDLRIPLNVKQLGNLHLIGRYNNSFAFADQLSIRLEFYSDIENLEFSPESDTNFDFIFRHQIVNEVIQLPPELNNFNETIPIDATIDFNTTRYLRLTLFSATISINALLLNLEYN